MASIFKFRKWGQSSERSLGLPKVPNYTGRKPGLEPTVLRVDKTPREGPLETGGQAEEMDVGFSEEEEKVRTRAGFQALSILHTGCS